jgi:RNA polymerase sigma-70 factor (ECF subfamily)
LETDFQFEKIGEAMKNLDTESREIVYLKFIEEKNNKEISDILNISNDNVRQKVSRSIKKLRTLLDTDIT